MIKSRGNIVEEKKMLLAVVLFKCVDCCMLAGNEAYFHKFWSNVVTLFNSIQVLHGPGTVQAWNCK